MNKLIIILGPNASGKSTLAIKLAKKFNGEIVSADSRQVYRGLNLGTGKVTKAEQKIIPHHLLDVVSPKKKFSLAQYQRLAFKAIDNIINRGKVPFLVGGTGLYIQAVCENLAIPQVKPDKKLRTELEKLNLKQLQRRLKKIDPRSFQYIDRKNPRRLIRAIEVAEATGKSFWDLKQKKPPKYDCLKLGVTYPKTILQQRIKERLKKRLKQGMIKEVDRLLQSGVRYKRLYDLGLEYRRIAQYLQGEIRYQEMIERLYLDICQFAKRQMTWFKRDRQIHWLKNQKQAEGLIKNFVNRI